MGNQEHEYKKAFNGKEKNALEHALDIRKFEIELYWKRATYFWALIAATFAGYFAVLAADHMLEKLFNAYVIGCIGFVFSLAWFLANRGSKFWQENWENHVDMLEDTEIGPLYKTILRRPISNGLEKWIDGPRPISVSKVNQWISLFTLLIWLPLIVNVMPPFNCMFVFSVKHCIVAAITISVSLFLVIKTGSHLGDLHHSAAVRRTTVIDD
jgi:hypothetical protein